MELARPRLRSKGLGLSLALCHVYPSMSTPIPPESLGTSLRALRLERGVGIRELARRAGTSKRSIQDWETDRYTPGGTALDRILVALEAPARLRARMLARAAPEYARVHLAHTPLGAPVDAGQVLRAMRLRQGTTQAEVARAGRIDQRTVSRWESGESLPSAEALHAALFALGASPEEALALMSVERRQEMEGDVRHRLHLAKSAPLALRDVLLLGVESELWWRAVRDGAAEPALCDVVSTRAHQCLLRGAIDEIDGHVGRALRLARSTGLADPAAGAVFAGCWRAQRVLGGAPGAARALGRWSGRMKIGQNQDWLRSAQGFATIRAGDAAHGVDLLARLAGERQGGDRSFFLTNLVEAHLLAGQPELAAETLESMDGPPGPLPVAKALLARGKEPPTGVIEAARAFGSTSWGAGREMAQIERGLVLVRRGRRARFR